MAESRKNIENAIVVDMHTNVLNWQLEHSLDIVRKSDMHSYNTHNKDTVKSPKSNAIGENIVQFTTVLKTLMS